MREEEAFRRAVSALVERLDREIARQELGTVRVGGLAKVGAALEAMLESAFRLACAHQGSDPAQTYRQLDRGRRLSKAGSGQLLRALRDIGIDHPDQVGSVLRALHADCSKPAGSAVDALVRVRNENAHEGRYPAAATGAMVGVLALLRE